ncbi:MAG: hypothetical protein H7Y32_16520 [Chloroflexales bacterium]|nr:hypothetical protein [Chloroflexales bacterium]
MFSLRRTLALVALAAGLTMTMSTAHAANASDLGGLRAVVHGAPALRLSGCLHALDEPNEYLFVADIENTGAAPVAPFAITLHNAQDALLGEQSFAGLAPGAAHAYTLALSGNAADDQPTRTAGRDDDERGDRVSTCTTGRD